MSNYITKRTQDVTNTRNRVHKIILFLKNFRGPHSIHNIRAKTRVDLQKAENLAVKTALQSNEKVTVMGTTFQYRPCISGINNRAQLQSYIQQRSQGVKLKELEDAYGTAKIDLARWQATGRTVQFTNSDTKQIIVFWYFGRLRKHPIQTEKEKEIERKLKKKNDPNYDEEEEEKEEKKIDMSLPDEIKDNLCNHKTFPLIGDSIISTWNDIKISGSKEELERQLKEVNLISGQFTKKRLRQKAASTTGRQKKRRRISMSRMTLTNTHMLQDQELGKEMQARNDKLNGGNERELPTLPTNNK
eukprot:CAMPEP_0201580472 /NCGR_PEP_ID=MMETSP0190_2-20130828/47046_1 /ASSEMBLY_ACC=CAM_ASM_000263 /TAXON_ID=37353 /ORGANISM="Rosalina sp." /LENGTH=301 /DNA_ID=CAMNT_0048016571 /DNA_START=25 /DNA_END=930 /DNA_ORIENTATION=-